MTGTVTKNKESLLVNVFFPGKLVFLVYKVGTGTCKTDLLYF